MRLHVLTALMASLVIILITPAAFAATEAFELGEANADQRPGGKEADAIAGDYVLRNDLIEAVISSDAPRRKADMGTFWGAITPASTT